MAAGLYSDRKKTEMNLQENEPMKTIQERMAAEDRVKERVDEEGNRWTKVYFGGGEHFRNWLEQCRELGEVMVEPVDATGYTCFEQGGETLYRIWMKMDETEEAN
jgi:hypothetical protein